MNILSCVLLSWNETLRYYTNGMCLNSVDNWKNKDDTNYEE